MLIGAVSVVSPYAGAAAIAACVAVVLFTYNRLPQLFLASMVIVLGVLAFLDRGGAYIGAAPVYLGELALGLAALTMLATIGRHRFGAIHWLLLLFAAFGVARTVPYLARDGIDALRDGVVWGYAAFAIALSFVVRPNHFPRIVELYRIALRVFLVWVPVVLMVSFVAGAALPTIPGSDVQIIDLKSGDLAVHLAGAAAFVLFGLHHERGPTIAESLLWPLWLVGVAMTGAVSRSALLTVMTAVLLILALQPSKRLYPLFVVTALVACGVALLNPQIDVGRDRDLSAQQITRNVASLVSDDKASNLQGTEDWRKRWWSEIVDYTVHGPYFWQGKGFGVNLADDDGFQSSDDSLRSPHNAHMTILARMGVPGLILWLLLQGVFGWSLLRALFRARARGEVFWARIDSWLFVYWAAMLVNMTFDVYLEGPQGGIWFWSIFGLGLAALAAQRSSRQATGSTRPNAILDARPQRP
jgi:hypothetical protein